VGFAIINKIFAINLQFVYIIMYNRREVYMIKLKVITKSGEQKAFYQGSFIEARIEGRLNEGDKISVSLDGCFFLGVKINKMKESVLYLPKKFFEFTIPSEREIRGGYDEDDFNRDYTEIKLYEADEKAYEYRNLLLNPYDLKRGTGAYPHASANFVTREDPCFYARNAIDGVIFNQGHGNYPYHSWAGGARNDLEYYVDFGREVSRCTILHLAKRIRTYGDHIITIRITEETIWHWMVFF
jgi:hypothetical protein